MSTTNSNSASGCPVHASRAHDPVPFFSDGDLNFKAHDVGWIMCGALALVATITSCWLIRKHLSFYYHPTEQRHIVRLLLMPVVYAVCSFLSYMFYREALYFQLVRDCYEALVIASFFFLLLSYLSNPPPSPDHPVPHPYATRQEREAQLRESVKDLHLRKWMWPLGWLKWRPAGGGPGEGEAFMWWMRVCIGQYVLVRPLSTLASVIGEATGYYCLASWSPKYVHIWSSAAITVSVTVAMYCVLQLYMPLGEPLKPYQPVLKSVVFLTFWQETALSFLVTLDVIKDREYWTAEEIVIGLSALLSCLEMVLFAFLHVKAFSYLPYRALASPVRLSPDGTPLLSPPATATATDDEPPPLDPDKPHSFASWSAWHLRVAARDAALSRLATPKLPPGFDASSGAPPRRADGLPLLQQTRRGRALRAALDLRDLFGEIGDEARFVLRGGRVDEVALLEARRGDDLEKAFGARRPAAGRARGAGGGYDDEEETPLERDLRVLKEGAPRPVVRAAKLAEDGSLVPAVQWNARPRHQSSLAAVPRPVSHERPAVAADQAASPSGWWASLRNASSRARRPPLDGRGTFEQLPRLDYAPLPVKHVPTVVGSNWCIPVPPAHRLGTPLPSFGTPLPAPSARKQHRESHRDPSAASSAAASHDSFTRLPRTTLRPASYVPPHRASPLPSPPPFSHFRRLSQPSVSASPSAAASADERPAGLERPSPTRRSSPPHAHAHSHSVPCAIPAATSSGPAAPRLALPPAVLLMASPESRQSRGLPPGAMPPRS